MLKFLIPLLLGFMFNSASAFTTFYSRRFGERKGRLTCIILRDVVGIPLWAIGYAMAVATPSYQMFDPNFISSLLACLLLLSGATIIITGLVTIRWRAVTPSVNDTLVTHGIYTHIRHPLYSGMFLELAGLSLWVPTVSVTIACLLGMVWVIIQARLEEMDLLERLPAYKDYMQQVPRFVPKLRQR